MIGNSKVSGKGQASSGGNLLKFSSVWEILPVAPSSLGVLILNRLHLVGVNIKLTALIRVNWGTGNDVK